MSEQDMLTVLERLARQAGDITLKHFQNADLAVEEKTDSSPVTVADRETEKFLREQIAQLYPNDKVFGEEFGEDPGSSEGRRWIVDPIDGTKSFIHGIPLYGVMIGIEDAGIMIAGAVFIPPLNDLVIAERGKGCWWNGKRASVSKTGTLDKALVLTTDVANHKKYGKHESWEKVCSGARLMRTWGDCYGHILVATGRADAMFDPQMNPWDCAALLPILEEAGGTFTDYRGNPTIYGDDAISTNGILLKEIKRVINVD